MTGNGAGGGIGAGGGSGAGGGIGLLAHGDGVSGAIDLRKYADALDRDRNAFLEFFGHVSKVVGLTIESDGPEVDIGELCEIQAPRKGKVVRAEVVGFRDGKALLMPLGDMGGVGPGNKVVATGASLAISVGEAMRGRVLDGLGNPIDGGAPISTVGTRSVDNAAPHPLARRRITEPLALGVKVLDGLLTVGKGQRVGIFSGSGVGKSTLMGMIARNTKADVNVIALIGERGREVREFLEKDLKEEGLARSVVVVATSDQPALVRQRGAFVATAIAEHYRDKGMDVLLLMDSLTRFAMAQREIGLAVGEPPVSRGYTPSVFGQMPRLLERAGSGESGSITGLYTVLVDGDDLTEPVTDTARGTLDGHIVLARSLANRNQYPAVDVLASVSRLMPDIVAPEHLLAAAEVKKVMAVYRDAEDLINIGAYAMGSNEKIDRAIVTMPSIQSFIEQRVDEPFTFDETVGLLASTLHPVGGAGGPGGPGGGHGGAGGVKGGLKGGAKGGGAVGSAVGSGGGGGGAGGSAGGGGMGAGRGRRANAVGASGSKGRA